MGDQYSILKEGNVQYIYIYIYICSPHGFILLDPRNVHCLLQYETVKCGQL